MIFDPAPINFEHAAASGGYESGIVMPQSKGRVSSYLDFINSPKMPMLHVGLELGNEC